MTTQLVPRDFDLRAELDMFEVGALHAASYSPKANLLMLALP
jgi:hypothetical protein